jgi:actin-like ATPase involved in cell morphogenesis
VTYAVGIDVGTTFSAAATWRDGRAATVALGDRAPTVPSVLFLRDDGVMLVGEAAVRRAVTEPLRVVREFKRRIGDTVPVVLGGRRFDAAQLTAHMVRWVVDKVSEREGGPPDYAVLTHPASWGQHRLSLLADAAAHAGLPHAGLLPEPVAAGLYYASQQRVPAGALLAVYDLGGGTFDATLLRKSATSFEIVGSPRGDDRLGGVDMDQAVLDHVVRTMGDRWPDAGLDDPALLPGLAQVRAAAVDAKEALSSDTHATVPVVLPGCTGDVRIVRSELERMVAPVVLRTVDLVRQTCLSAGVGPDELDAVLLVGGASRMPLVAELVTDELGRPVVVDAHPKYAVCLGAAIAAAARVEGRDPAPAAPAPPPPVPPAPGPPGPAAVAISVDLGSSQLTGASDWRLPRSRRPPDPLVTVTDRDDAVVVRLGRGGDARQEAREGRRVVGMAVAAAVAVAALVAGVVAWAPRPDDGGGSGSGAGSGSRSGSGPGARAGEEASRPAGTALLAGGPVPPAAAPEAMLGVAALEGGHLVAVGSAGGGRPAAWESFDAGASWAPTWTAPESGDGEQGASAGVTSGPAGLVAVGWAGPADESGSPTRAAVWLSAGGDPGSWDAAELSGLEGAAALHDVVADGAGLVAVGRDLSDDPGDGDGGIWRSDDGSAWRRAATAGLGGPGRQELNRLVRLADGRWLALGRQMRGAQMTPAVWTSPDLSSWTEADGHPAGPGGVPSVWGLAVLDDGSVVAAGSRPGLPGDPAGTETALWLAAPDALHRWRPLEPAPGSVGAGPGDQQVRGLVRTGGATVAVGADGESAAGWPVQIAR